MMVRAMRKVKTYTFLTHLERAEAESIAQAKQLTLSEWIREAVILNLSGPRPALVVNPSLPTNHHLPTSKELLNDFVFGDLNDTQLGDEPKED
jgi:hypothetical protein